MLLGILIYVLALFFATIRIASAQDFGTWLDACSPYRANVEQILDEEHVSRAYFYLMVAESRAGVPDLFLACVSSCFNGLFIEMKKTRGGRVSESQKVYLELLKDRGYAVAVCHGWLEAKQSIESYLRS